MIYGSLSESSNINEPDQRDAEFTECSRCDGDGWIFGDGYIIPSNEKLTCPVCKGDKQIEITD